ncbi:TonB-dependent receptor [Undibacterium sp. Xuan67W]|uniref:TonB-dependent receptor n=1 Tax=Undibacterium sp. Xuan67W TaxID=3413057 RepID=UPI003BF2DE7C
MKRRLTPLAAALLAAVAAPVALAQTAPVSTTDSTLPEIKVQDNADKNRYAPEKTAVAGKVATDLRDIAQTVNVVNRAVLNAQAATTMTEALRNVPGITISAGEGGQIGDNINLRGYSARTDVYLDGFRDRGQYTRDTFNLEAVEVLKGPSSMLFGRGSTGGVINQASRKPNLKASGEVSGTVGTDSYYRSTVDINRPLSETSAFRIDAFAQDSKSTRDVIENKRFGVAPSVRFGIGTPTEILIAAFIQRNKDIPDYGFPVVNGKPVDAPANRFYGFTDDKYDQDADIVSASIKHKFDKDTTLQNRTQYGKYKTTASPTPLSIIGTPAAGAALSQITANYSTRDRVVDDSSLDNQTDLIAKMQLAGIQHTFTTGLSLAKDKYANTAYAWTGLGSLNLASTTYAAKPATAVRTLSTQTNSDADTVAVYLNDQIDLNKEWKIVGGVRWDRYSASQSAYNYSTKVRTDLSHTDKMLSTRAGVIWQPSESQSYYVSYGTSFNPSTETLVLSASNVNLDPEKNKSIEAGAKLDLLDGNLSLNGAIFKVKKTNARTTDPLTSVVTLSGDTQVQGFEVGVVGRITSDWQVMAGYTLLDGKINALKELSNGISAVGKTLPNTPRDNVTVWTTYSPMQNWEIGGGILYASKRYLNNFETAYVDAYKRYDATIAYKQKDYDIRLNLQNLTDEKYFEAASGGRATPVKGRSALVTVAYRF